MRLRRGTIIATYAPTNISNDNDKQSYYDDLQDCIFNIPKYNLLIIAGDFNARIGKDSHLLFPKIIGKHTYHDETNDNGKRLVSLCETSHLKPIQMKFPQPLKKLWTWTDLRTKAKFQIDHILINTKWINSARNCRSYNSVELDSDHRIITAKIKLSLKIATNKGTPKCYLNWKSLAENGNLQERYNVEITNKFNALYDCNDNLNTQNKYNIFEQCVKETNDLIIKENYKKRESWVTEKTEQLCQERDNAKTKYRQTNSDNNYKYWKNQVNLVKQSFKDDRIKFYEKLAHQAEQANLSNNMKDVYKIVNIISGKVRKNTAATVNLNDNCKVNPDNMLGEWKAYFDKLLNNDTKINQNIKEKQIDLSINTDNFTYNEIQSVIKTLKNGKASGIDKNITNESLKYGGHKIILTLRDI